MKKILLGLMLLPALCFGFNAQQVVSAVNDSVHVETTGNSSTVYALNLTSTLRVANNLYGYSLRIAVGGPCTGIKYLLGTFAAPKSVTQLGETLNVADGFFWFKGLYVGTILYWYPYDAPGTLTATVGTCK